jgi:hypothetical protein
MDSAGPSRWSWLSTSSRSCGGRVHESAICWLLLHYPQITPQDGPITAGTADQASWQAGADEAIPDAPAPALPVRRRDGRGYDLRHTRAVEVWPAGRRPALRLVPSVGSAGDTGVIDQRKHSDRDREPE